LDGPEPQSAEPLIDSNLLIVFGVTLFAVLGVSSIAPVLSQVIAEFGITEAEAGLLVTSFTLPGVFLTPFLGVMADRLGRKAVLVPSLVLFGVAGGLCGLVRDFQLLLVLRFFQGAGAAALGSLNATLLGDLYEGHRRARAMGLNASVLSVGTAVYPLLGGGLATLAWYYPFLLPWLALPLSVAVVRSLRNPEPEGNMPMRDYLQGIWQGARNPRIIGIFTLGILVFIILYGSWLTYFSVLLGRRFGAPSLVIGLVMFTSSITTATVSSQLGWLSRRFGPLKLILASFTGYALSLALIPFFTGLWWLIGPALLFGASQGLALPSLMTLLAGEAPLERRAIFMSLNGAMLRVGQTLGPLLMGVVFARWHYPGVFWGGSLAAAVGFAVAVAVLRSARPSEGPAEPGATATTAPAG